MSIFDDWFDISTEAVNGHNYNAVNLLDEDHEPVVEDVAAVVPNHYIVPEAVAHTLERLGKPAAAQKLQKRFVLVTWAKYWRQNILSQKHNLAFR